MTFAFATGSGGAFAAALIFLGASGAGTTQATADVATRCGAYGCQAIRCNYTGDRCYRIDGSAYGGGYYRSRYDRDYDDYDRDYADGYGGHLVCDSDGDRCYRSHEPWWNYREYYRRHGYHWLHETGYDNPYRYRYGGYRYGGYHDYDYDDYGERRFTDRLNRDEFAHARDFNDEY